MKQTITRSKGGSKEREVKFKDIQVPDVCHIAMRCLKMDSYEQEMVLELWHLCHDLKQHIRENMQG